MTDIKWGIIGVGNVTEVKSGPGLQDAEGSQLVAVMRRNGDLAKNYAQRHHVSRWYDDANALINDPEVNAIYIATPPDSHLDYTRQAAKAGKPVYVEKPMARNHNECQQMIGACQAADVPLFVAYYRRGLPRFHKIKELIDSGAIGTVRYVNINLYSPDHTNPAGDLPWRVIPEIAGGGKFVDLGSHMLDFLDFALGPIIKAQAFAANQAGNYPAEDIVCGNFMFESGVLGTGNWCFATYESLDKTEIVGTKGRIEYSTFDEEPIILETAKGSTTLPIENPRHIQQPLIQTIVDELRGKDQCPSSGISGARTSWVMDEMLKGYYHP